MVDSLKKAAFEASGKRWVLSEGRVQKYVNSARYRGRVRRCGRNRNPVEWWDVECDRLIEDRKRACKAYRKHSSLANYVEKKRCEALVRRAIRRKKRESFKSFAESLDRFCDMKYVWNPMNVFKVGKTLRSGIHSGIESM